MSFGGSALAMNISIKNNMALRNHTKFSFKMSVVKTNSKSSSKLKYNSKKFSKKSEEEIAAIKRSISDEMKYALGIRLLKTVLFSSFIALLLIYLI